MQSSFTFQNRKNFDGIVVDLFDLTAVITTRLKAYLEVLLRYLVNERRYSMVISRTMLFVITAVKCATCTVDSSRQFGRRKRITKASRRKIDLGLMTRVYTHYFCSCVQSTMLLRFLVDKVWGTLRTCAYISIWYIYRIFRSEFIFS